MNRIARRLTALVRQGRPRIAVARIEGYHADQAHVTVREADAQPTKEDTHGHA